MAAFALKKVAYIRLESVADFIGIRSKSIKLLGALEGGTTGDNLHYHCVIGRLPERLTNSERDYLIRSAWQQTSFGNEQVHIQTLTTTGWMGYMVKEVGKLSCDIIDWENVRN